MAIPQHESDEDEQYNHTDHKRACVEGSCHECGVWDAEGKYNPNLWIMSCPLEVRYIGHYITYHTYIHTYISYVHTYIHTSQHFFVYCFSACSDSDAIKHREFEVEYYKGDEHPSREAFFQGGRSAVDCDDEEGGFGPTNTEGSNSKGQRVLIQKWVITSRREFLQDYLMPIVKSFFLHQWVNHRQALCYKDLKRLLPRLPEGHVIFISDFAMNASPLLENKEAFFANKGQLP